MKYLWKVELERTDYQGKKTTETRELFAESLDDINTYRLGGFQQDRVKVLSGEKIKPQNTIEIDADIERNELMFSVDIDDHLDSTLERAEDLETACDEQCEDLDYDEALEMMGYYEAVHDNTYNYCSDFSDDIDFKVFLPDGEDDSDWFYNDEAVVFVRVHTGLDIRGGYGSGRLYKPNHYDGLTYFLDAHVRLWVEDDCGNEVDQADGDYAWGSLERDGYQLVSVESNGEILIKKDDQLYKLRYYHPAEGV